VFFILYSLFAKISLKNSKILLNSFIKDEVKSFELGNPCKYQIVGEPIDSGKNYIKVKLTCKNGISNNTLSLKPMDSNSFKDIMRVLGTTNKFDYKQLFDINKLHCLVGGDLLNINSIIYPTNQINCEEI
jgi:hypothetical protein